MAELTPRPDQNALQGQPPAKTAQGLDHQLDKAIEDSFPASDPVQLAMPHENLEGSSRAAPYAAGALGLVAIGGLIAAALLMRRR
jgi:hypothetical protein